MREGSLPEVDTSKERDMKNTLSLMRREDKEHHSKEDNHQTRNTINKGLSMGDESSSSRI